MKLLSKAECVQCGEKIEVEIDFYLTSKNKLKLNDAYQEDPNVCLSQDFLFGKDLLRYLFDHHNTNLIVLHEKCKEEARKLMQKTYPYNL